MADIEERFEIWTLFFGLGGSRDNCDLDWCEYAKFTGVQPFEESLRATPSLRIDHLRL